MASKKTLPPFDRPWFSSILFMLMISFPLVYMCLGGQEVFASTENRTLAAMPGWSWKPTQMMKFPEKIQSYFNDHFGLRNSMIYIRHQLMLHGFGYSPLPQKVVIGKEGWLYMMEYNNYEDFLGMTPLAQTDIEALRQDIYAKLSPEKENTRHFYFLVAPDKETVYPEFLPDNLSGIDTTRRIRDFYQRVQLGDGIQTINVLDSLILNKSAGKSYYQTDTHWNTFGIFIVAQEIVKQMRKDYPQLIPYSMDQIEQEPGPAASRDIAILLGFPEIREAEMRVLPRITAQVESPPEDENVFLYTSNQSNGLSLLLFGDSFSVHLAPYLAEHFSKVIFVKNQVIFQPYIDACQPDIVLWEIVERMYLHPSTFP